MVSKPKTVYLLSHEQPPMLGGAGVVAQTIFTGLRALGLNITKSVAATHFASPFARVAGFFFAFRALLSDVIIINDLYYKKLWLTLFRGYCCSRCIIYLHGSEPEFLIQDARYRDTFLNMCIKAQKVVAVSDYMKQKLLDSIADEKIKTLVAQNTVVIRNGIDTECFQLQPEVEVVRPLTLVTASRIVEEKGYIEVAQQIVKIREILDIPIRWNIVGDGPFRAELESYIKTLGLSEQVHFLGRLNHRQLATTYNQADIFVLLSNLQESLGLVFMEASSCGCWSIGYNRFGAKEAIIAGQTGNFIDSPEALPNAIANYYHDSTVTRTQISVCARSHFSAVHATTQLKNTILGIE
ncbi:glycosyltransferase family 4 protein [Pseudoalteromonas sp. Of11M-6]|uniref:glycosyltransferase family 4 protein n=1 Tax=Pseudoalteromonas sp. Of11M-6 TaxID=2917754 RepID=UPI001EF3DFDE|nr:glycosyltransferase family 4 protein [Pseudoalteromonas sp. Of11M-6]